MVANTASNSEPGPLRVALVNDYEIVVRGLEIMLAPYADRVEVVELDVSVDVARRVHVALYDTFSVTQVDAADIEKLIAHEHVDAVVVFTWNMSRELVATAREKGVRGYLSKSLGAAEFVDALERVAAGDVVVEPEADLDPPNEDLSVAGGDWPGRAEGLTVREAEVVTLITRGLSNTEISERTYLSLNTVKSYIRTAYRRMGVTSRSQAVLWGLAHDMAPEAGRIARDPES